MWVRLANDRRALLPEGSVEWQLVLDGSQEANCHLTLSPSLSVCLPPFLLTISTLQSISSPPSSTKTRFPLLDPEKTLSLDSPPIPQEWLCDATGLKLMPISIPSRPSGTTIPTPIPSISTPTSQTSMACVKHTQTQTDQVRGRGQKLINQILLSAVKLLSLPACTLHKTALKHKNIPNTVSWARNTRPVRDLGPSECSFMSAFVCDSVHVLRDDVSSGLGWMAERKKNKQTKPGGQALSPSLSFPFPLPLLSSASSLFLWFDPKCFRYLILSPAVAEKLVQLSPSESARRTVYPLYRFLLVLFLTFKSLRWSDEFHSDKTNQRKQKTFSNEDFLKYNMYYLYWYRLIPF